jgi:nicotinamidase-related amidase
VASTVRDAHVRDYHVIVLSDGCAAFSEAAHQAALADMASVGEVMDSATFLKQLG